MVDALKALREIQHADGRRVGNWSLTEPLSRGGQGVTWRAIWNAEGHSPATAVMRGVELQKSVIKLMIPPAPTDVPVSAAHYPDYLEKIVKEFLKEFAILSKLDCPYIPKFYQAGRQETKAGWAVPWCAIELVEGRSLEVQLKKNGPLGEGPLLEVAFDMLTALDLIHSAGLVHLDLKPANVMLEPGRAILIDFGIAGLAGVTQHGISGTPGFFPPENLDDQLEREDFSPAVDLFKLGVTLASSLGIGPTKLWGVQLPAAPRGHGKWGDEQVRRETRAAMRKGPNLSGVSPGVAELLATLLAFDPQQRGSAQALSRRVKELQRAVPSAAKIAVPASVPKVASKPPAGKASVRRTPASAGGSRANVGARVEVVDQLGLNWTGVVVDFDPKKSGHILIQHESTRGAQNIRSYPINRVVRGRPLK